MSIPGYNFDLSPDVDWSRAVPPGVGQAFPGQRQPPPQPSASELANAHNPSWIFTFPLPENHPALQEPPSAALRRQRQLQQAPGNPAQSLRDRKAAEAEAAARRGSLNQPTLNSNNADFDGNNAPAPRPRGLGRVPRQRTPPRATNATPDAVVRRRPPVVTTPSQRPPEPTTPSRAHRDPQLASSSGTPTLARNESRRPPILAPVNDEEDDVVAISVQRALLEQAAQGQLPLQPRQRSRPPSNNTVERGRSPSSLTALPPEASPQQEQAPRTATPPSLLPPTPLAVIPTPVPVQQAQGTPGRTRQAPVSTTGIQAPFATSFDMPGQQPVAQRRQRRGNPSTTGNQPQVPGAGGWELTDFSYEALLELGSMAVPTGLSKQQLARYKPKPYTIPNADNGAEPKTEECTVCIEEFSVGDQVLQIACGHTFHCDCILPWLARTNKCPTCRYEIERHDPIRR